MKRRGAAAEIHARIVADITGLDSRVFYGSDEAGIYVDTSSYTVTLAVLRAREERKKAEQEAS